MDSVGIGVHRNADTSLTVQVPDTGAKYLRPYRAGLRRGTGRRRTQRPLNSYRHLAVRWGLGRAIELASGASYRPVWIASPRHMGQATEVCRARTRRRALGVGGVCPCVGWHLLSRGVAVRFSARTVGGKLCGLCGDDEIGQLCPPPPAPPLSRSLARNNHQDWVFPICITSAGQRTVLQIAAHEESFGLQRYA